MKIKNKKNKPNPRSGTKMKIKNKNALSSDCSILQAEAWGLQKGLRATIFLGIGSLEVEGFNLVVINEIRQCWKVSWAIRSLVMDSLVDLRSFNAVSINHCFRKRIKRRIICLTKIILFCPWFIGFLLMMMFFLPSSERMM